MPSVQWNVGAANELTKQIERDQGKTERPDPVLLDKGYYSGPLVEVVVRESRAGDPQLMLVFEVEGQRLARFPTFSLSGYEYAAKDIINTGVDPAKLPDFEVDESSGMVQVDLPAIAKAIEAAVLGATFKVGVSQDEYEGKPKNGVYWYGVESKPEVTEAPEPEKVSTGSGFGFD